MRAAGVTLALLAAFAGAWLLSERGHQALAQGKKGGGGTGCSVNSVTSVAFGNYEPDAPTPLTSTGALLFSCKPANQELTVKVTIGPSQVSGSITDRAMRELGGTDQLHYNLFQDQRGQILWGDGNRGGSPAFVTGTKDFRVEIYGIARNAQQVSVGLYADVLRIAILP